MPLLYARAKFPVKPIPQPARCLVSANHFTEPQLLRLDHKKATSVTSAIIANNSTINTNTVLTNLSGIDKRKENNQRQMSATIEDPSRQPIDVDVDVDNALTAQSIYNVSLLCGAIGDSSGTAVRARALWALHTHGPQNVSTLSTLLSIPHATLSGHLRTLENAGLISSQRVDGVNKIKTLNRDILHNLITQLNNLFFQGEE